MDNSLTKIRLNSSTTLGGGGGPGSKTISILPEAIGDISSTGGGTDFVTVDGNYVRPLNDANNEYQELSNDNGLITLDNTKVTSNTNIASSTDTQVNSIKISSGTTLTIGSGHRLTVNSGAILAVGTSPSTISGGNLAFEQYQPAGVYNPGNPFFRPAGQYERRSLLRSGRGSHRRCRGRQCEGSNHHRANRRNLDPRTPQTSSPAHKASPNQAAEPSDSSVIIPSATQRLLVLRWQWLLLRSHPRHSNAPHHQRRTLGIQYRRQPRIQRLANLHQWRHPRTIANQLFKQHHHAGLAGHQHD